MDSFCADRYANAFLTQPEYSLSVTTVEVEAVVGTARDEAALRNSLRKCWTRASGIYPQDIFLSAQRCFWHSVHRELRGTQTAERNPEESALIVNLKNYRSAINYDVSRSLLSLFFFLLIYNTARYIFFQSNFMNFPERNVCKFPRQPDRYFRDIENEID